MPSSHDLLYIIKRLEQLQAELIMEGANAIGLDHVTEALNELYWGYKAMTAYEE